MELAQTAFKDGILTIKCACKMIFILPKGDNDYIGIGLVEVLCKAMLRLINCRIEDIIQGRTGHGDRLPRGGVDTASKRNKRGGLV